MGVIRAGNLETVGQSNAQFSGGSLKFDSSNSPYLSRTFTTPTSTTQWTYSAWIKRVRTASNGYGDILLATLNPGTGTDARLAFLENNTFYYLDWSGGELATTSVYRDFSAWMHLVFVYDSANATSTDRLRFYINGTRITSSNGLSSASYPSSNATSIFNGARSHTMGAFDTPNPYFMNAYLSNVFWIDGQALDPSYFGYTDPLTNTWRPKKYTGTYGTNGFWLPLDGNTPIGQDQSGRGNNWTPAKFGGSNTIEKATGALPILNTDGGGKVAQVGVFGSKVGKTYTVTVPGGTGGGFYLDGTQEPTLSFIRGATYTFDQSAASNSGHPLLFSTTQDGSTYSDGVTTSGTPGSSGAFTKITVPHNSADTLYYKCGNHSGMGASISVTTDEKKSDLYAWKNVLALPLVGIKSDFSNAINSGTSNKTVTVTNAVASSTQSNFYGGSFAFDGNGDYLIVSENSELLINGTECTIEGWYYVNSSFAGNEGSSLPLFAQVDVSNTSTSGSANFWSFADATYLYFGSSGGYMTVSKSLIPIGKWFHYAAVVTGTTNAKLFIDGVLVGSGTIGAIGSNSGRTTNLGIIRSGGGGSPSYLNGYIQDFRIYKGLAKYTQNFIPASTDPDILPDTPSGVAYSSNVVLAPTNEGAVAFDGSGDYLSLADSNDWNLGSGDFTIEAFVHAYSFGSYEGIVGQWPQNGGNVANSFVFEAVSGNIEFYYSVGSTLYGPISGGPLTQRKWQHLAAVRSGNTMYIFVDGILTGSGSVTLTFNDAASPLTVGGNIAGGGSWNGFISNLHIVKGTALYTSNFTPPTGPISSVANTKLLCCKSNSSATAADVTPGTITANGNAAATNFNPFTVNINAVRGQESGYATWNPLAKGSDCTLSNGNLDVTWGTAGSTTQGTATIGFSSGKWYWETTITASSASPTNAVLGITTRVFGDSEYPGYSATSWGYRGSDGQKWNNVSGSSYGSSYTIGDVIGVLFDADNGTLTFYKNGISQGQAFSGLTSGPYFPAIGDQSSSQTFSAATNFGQKPFKFPPPAGFQPLALANTPRPTIVRPDQYVGVTTYTGNGSTQSINVGFKPDLVWVKNRNGANNNVLQDSVRGFGSSKNISSNQTQEEGADTDGVITGVTNTGFNVAINAGNGNGTNRTNYTYVGWAWKAGGNSNTYNINDIGYSTASAAGLASGTITPTGASVNTKSGFSIITYTGNGSTSSGVTIDHGLGNTPAFIITKKRSGGTDYGWSCWHKDLGGNYGIWLDKTSARNINMWAGYSNFSSTKFTPPDLLYGNESGATYVNYLWAEIPGFSKFGSYTGNGSSDGPMVVTGFRPRWILARCSTIVADWWIYDSVRGAFNVNNAGLRPNLSNIETTDAQFDFLSNGFKVRTTGTDLNSNGNPIIYAAFAETPSFNLYGGQSNAR